MMRAVTLSAAKGLLFLSATAMASACSRGVSVGSSSAMAQPLAPNTLTAQEVREGWKLLFDGKSLSQWRAYKADTISPRWTIIDGILTKTRPSDDIVTRETFSDFELQWDWKLAPGGNAGVFIRGNESQSKIYWSAVEFQLADDSLTADSKNPLTSAGAAYGLYAPPRGVAKFAGNWNTSRIVAKGTHVEHWMNGVKTLSYDVGSPDFIAKVEASKFKPYPGWGSAKSGVIAIQGDHAGSLELRNIKIRVLK
jgi:hypothetical protein